MVMPRKTKKERRHSAKTLKSLREKKNLSRRDIVERGISYHTITAYENARRVPDDDGLIALAGIFAMDVEALRSMVVLE